MSIGVANNPSMLLGFAQNASCFDLYSWLIPRSNGDAGVVIGNHHTFLI
jgi:hypothetical protein